MDEIVLREFVGGVEDGTLEVVRPGGTRHIQKTVDVQFLTDEGGVDGENSDSYEYSHEEIAVVRVTKWIYKLRSKADPSGPL